MAVWSVKRAAAAVAQALFDIGTIDGGGGASGGVRDLAGEAASLGAYLSPLIMICMSSLWSLRGWRAGRTGQGGAVGRAGVRSGAGT